MSLVSLRPASAADWDFVDAVTEATMRGYAERTFGRWRPQKREDFDPAIHQIVQYEGADVGCVELVEEPRALLLGKLYIAHSHQGRGIGTFLLQQLMARAHRSGKSIRLRVLRVNPARKFYEKHGFVVTETTKQRFFMEWRPPPAAPQVSSEDGA